MSLKVDYCDVTDDQPWIEAFCQNSTLTEFEGKIGNNKYGHPPTSLICDV